MGYYDEQIDLEYFVGKTISKIDGGEGSDELIFTFVGGDRVKMYHSQDCCESVYLSDVTGDLDYLIGSPIMSVFENTQDGSNEPDAYGERTYTFYTITTFGDSVTLRWIGESNGYYSTDVSICKM